MTFNPIHAMALKSVQIDIPAQTIASSTTLTLGSITDSSVVTVSGDIIVLPTGRDYFLTASINASQGSGNNNEFSFINFADGTTFSNQAKAFGFYTTSTTNANTYSGNVAMIAVDLASPLQVQLKKTIHSASTSIYKDNANAYVANSSITIFYTD
jgi:hypothetical protein